MDREPCNNILNPALGHMPSLRALKLDRLFLSEQGKNRFQTFWTCKRRSVR